jgi:hypothetical protein
VPAARSNSLTRRLLDAVDLALAGDWQAAHLIVQEHEDDRVASWIHAVVHRMEGDLANARYWYRRCDRELQEQTSTAAELEQIKATLTA